MKEGRGMAGFHSDQEDTDAYLAKRVNSRKSDRPPHDLLAQPPICPECDSSRIWKDGLRRVRVAVSNPTQRYLCRNCGYRFSLNHKNPNKHTIGRQVCAEAKNLVTVETRQEQAAGATTIDNATINGKIIEFLWYLKNKGYAKGTVRTYIAVLKSLINKGASILDPQEIVTLIARQDWKDGNKNGYRANIIKSYDLFVTKILGLKWDKPRYTL